MSTEEAEETSSSLIKVRKVCKFLCSAMKVLFVVFCLGWIAASAATLYSLVNPGAFDVVNNVSVLSAILCIVYGAIAASIFLVLIGMFSDAAKGESPFTMTQVKRLRIVSAMLVLYAIVDLVASASTPFTRFDNLGLGYTSITAKTVIPINFTPIIAAAIVFSFSFVFKYGVLLQEFSDETL